MTDSLAMGAIPNGDTRHAAVKALRAGADILLIGTDRDIPTTVVDAAIAEVVSAVADGQLPASRIDSALARIQALKARYGQ